MSARRPRHGRAWWAGVALGSATVASACAPGPLTAPHLATSVAHTFANLWVLREGELGHPSTSPAALASSAVCTKGLPTDVQHGAGSDWVCRVTWLVSGPGTPVTATYTVNLASNGCYAADGDGPASVNGNATFVDAAGRRRVDPLHAFNGCLPTL